MQHIAAPARGCFHLSLRTTEMAEASSLTKSHQLNNVAAIFEYKVSAQSLQKTPPPTTSELAKIARALVCLDYVASVIVNANHGL